VSSKTATLTAAALLALCAACAQTAPKDLPKETFAINMHPKIAPELRERVEKELDQLFADEKDLF